MRMAPVEQRRKKYLMPPRRRGAVPLCLLLVAWLAREALGRSLDWGLWAGGAKWGVSGTIPRNRRMLRVGCPRYVLLFA